MIRLKVTEQSATLSVKEKQVLLNAAPAVRVGSKVTVDPVPTDGSENAVSSGGVFAALGAADHVKADKVQFTDGETFQQKLDSGELTGPAGPRGETYQLTDSDKDEIAKEAAAKVVYVQPDEPPDDAPDGSLWVDTDEEINCIARAEGVGF